MVDRSHALTRPASYSGSAPLVRRPQNARQLAWMGTLALLFAVYAAGMDWDRKRVEARMDREAKEAKAAKDRFIASFKDTPQDVLIGAARKRYADAAADFVDQHLSWRLLSKRGETPVRAEPTRAIQQLGVLAGEIGEQAAFRSFISANQNRWLDKRDGILTTDESGWIVGHRSHHVWRTIDSMKDLLKQLRRNAKFETLAKDPRFSDASSMLEGLEAADLNYQVGVGLKKLPK